MTDEQAAEGNVLPICLAEIDAIGTLNHDRSLRHARGMDPPLFLLPCYCSLVRRTILGIRFAFYTVGGTLDAECQPDGQSDYVVSGSDVFRRCPNPKRSLGMALGRPVEQAVLSFCAVLGGRNVGQQLEEPHRRLRQGPARPRQSMRSARTYHTEFTSLMGF